MQNAGFRVRVQGSGSRVQILGERVQGVGCRVQGSGLVLLPNLKGSSEPPGPACRS